MAKRLFLLLLASFLGIFGAPEILMASGSFDVQGLDSTNIVETPLVTEEKLGVEETLVEELATEATYVYSEPSYEVALPVYTVPSDSISIAGRTIRIVDVADTAVDAGDHVNKYGDKFLYGHNTGAVFGNIVNMGVGSRFEVTYGGASTTYVVARTVIFEKNVETGKLQLNGAGSYMRSVANAKSDGVQYDLSLMTCYGTSYGNGDASHRFVIFANAV